MRIGQDVSIQECRDEGYMVMDYHVFKFKRDPKNAICHFTKSYPLYIRQKLCMPVTEGVMILKEDYSWNDLMELYLQHQQGVDEGMGAIVGCTYADVELPEPYQVLNLASDLDSYCGINTQ